MDAAATPRDDMTIATSDPTIALVREALQEDAPDGDLTSALLIPADTVLTAELRAKQDGVLAGTAPASLVFAIVSQQDALGAIGCEWHRSDGDRVANGDVLATITQNFETAVGLAKDQVSAVTAFMTGKIKIDGSMGLLLGLQGAFAQLPTVMASLDVDYSPPA